MSRIHPQRQLKPESQLLKVKDRGTRARRFQRPSLFIESKPDIEVTEYTDIDDVLPEQYKSNSRLEQRK